ncbi:hypothetical protein BJV78DRAFT_582446 [Lactifluus subvellereus]|nr:hypothetical protein BJV78DRAFT_582446 [Lactifluus subvellereus]
MDPLRYKKGSVNVGSENSGMESKTHNKRGEVSSLSDTSEAATPASSPGRARRVSMKMKIKKGFKEVKERLSPHHHHHHHHHHSSCSGSDLALDESKTLADIHQHIQDQQRPVEPEPQQPWPEMAALEPYNVVPPSPQPPDDDDEQAPNPFLIDVSEEPLSDPEPELPAPALVLPPASSPLEASPSESIALSPASSQLPLPSEPAPVPLPSINVDKPVPAPPPASDTESEPEAPAVYLPQLVLPTMFLPIPNTDPLTTLLTKYISNPERRPQRDLTGEWTRIDFHTLVMRTAGEH